MSAKKVDKPSLLMAVAFTLSLVVAAFDTSRVSVPAGLGESLLFLGALLFVYTLAYLRRGFLGSTEPVLDHLVTGGPYGFSRHPLYLSFILILLGYDLLFGSPLGLALTMVLAIPSAIYRGRVEDRLLEERFGDEWRAYSKKVGFFSPRLRKDAENDWGGFT